MITLSLITITAILCWPTYAQYQFRLADTHLTQSHIVIPMVEDTPTSDKTRACRLQISKSSIGVKDLTVRYINEPELLQQHIDKCFGREFESTPVAKEEINKSEWTVSFQFGFSRTHYFNTDMHVDGAELNVTIFDFNFSG